MIGKQIFTNSAFLFGKFLISTIIALFSTRILINLLGLEGFGIQNVLMSYITVLNVMNVTLTTSTYRFLAFDLSNKEQLNKTFNTFLILHIILAIIVLLISEIIAKSLVLKLGNQHQYSSEALVLTLRIMSMITVINVLMIPYQGLLTAYQNFKIISIIEVIKNLLVLSAAIISGYLVGNRLVNYNIIVLASTILILGFTLAYCYNHHREIIKLNHPKLVRARTLEIVSFSKWISLGAIYEVLKVSGSQLIISSFFGPVAVSGFAIAMKINSFVQIPSNMVVQAAIPEITQLRSKNLIKKSTITAAYSSKYAFIIITLIIIPILINTELILDFWLGKTPEKTNLLTKILLITLIIESITSGLPAIFQAHGELKMFMLSGTIIPLLAFPIGSYFFYIGLGVESLLYLILVTSVIRSIYALIILKKINLMDFNLFRMYCLNPSFKGMIPIGFAVFIFYYIPINAIIKTIFLEIILISFMAISMLNKKEMQLLKNLL
jgi:O-antigen/teichoic acid export membrane protein